MASIKYELEAQVRGNIGRGASRRLRVAEQVPAVVYGAGEPAVCLALDHRKVNNALSHESFYSRILDLKIDKKNEKVILKAVQRHPSKPRIVHLDFQRIRADQKLHMHIPLHFIGEDVAPGVVQEGGSVSHMMTDVEVVCLPADLPEYIEIDLSHMRLNDVVHLSELKLPKGVEIAAFAHGVEGHDLGVVSIQIPRIIEEVVPVPTEEEAAAAAAAATPGAEGGAEKAAEAKPKKEAAGEGEKEKGKGK